jgi:hypothetical protein
MLILKMAPLKKCTICLKFSFLLSDCDWILVSEVDIQTHSKEGDVFVQRLTCLKIFQLNKVTPNI